MPTDRASTSPARAGSPPPSAPWPPCSTPGACRRSATPTATTPRPSKSATVSWKAFFFGSIDPGNFITVDKPPAALWVQALSVGSSASARGQHAAARGAGRGGLGADPAPPGPAVGRRHRRPPRGPGLRPDPGGGAHVPLQQPRRPAHPAVPGRGLGAVVGGGDRSHPPPAGCRPCSSGWPSTPRCSRPSWSCPPSSSSTCWPARPSCGKRIVAARPGRGHRWWWPAAGGSPSWPWAGRLAALHRQHPGQLHPQPAVRLQRPVPPLRQHRRRGAVPGPRVAREPARAAAASASAAPPGCCACSTLAGRPGGLAHPAGRGRPGRRAVAVPPRPPHRPHPGRVAAVGWLGPDLRGGVQPVQRRLPPLLQRSSWPRRWPPWPAPAAWPCGGWVEPTA